MPREEKQNQLTFSSPLFDQGHGLPLGFDDYMYVVTNIFPYRTFHENAKEK